MARSLREQLVSLGLVRKSKNAARCIDGAGAISTITAVCDESERVQGERREHSTADSREQNSPSSILLSAGQSLREQLIALGHIKPADVSKAREWAPDEKSRQPLEHEAREVPRRKLPSRKVKSSSAHPAASAGTGVKHPKPTSSVSKKPKGSTSEPFVSTRKGPKGGPLIQKSPGKQKGAARNSAHRHGGSKHAVSLGSMAQTLERPKKKLATTCPLCGERVKQGDMQEHKIVQHGESPDGATHGHHRPVYVHFVQGGSPGLNKR